MGIINPNPGGELFRARAIIPRQTPGVVYEVPGGFVDFEAYYRSFLAKGVDVLFASPATIPLGNKVSMIFTRTGEDVAVCGIHLAQVEVADVVEMTGASRADTEGRLQDLWSSIRSKFDPSIALDRFVWHAWGVGIRRPNPQISDVNAGPLIGTGDADSMLPPQVATSVTFKTSRRRNWGRIFLPACAVSNVAAGRLLLAYQTAVRDAFGTFLTDSRDASIVPVIWSPRHAGLPLKFSSKGHPENHDEGLDNPDTSSFALSVDQVQVDDLFDVMESRRYDKALVRLTHTYGA